jgi:hypothetical protein
MSQSTNYAERQECPHCIELKAAVEKYFDTLRNNEAKYGAQNRRQILAVRAATKELRELVHGKRHRDH